MVSTDDSVLEQEVEHAAAALPRPRLMPRLSLQLRVTKALASAGATNEILALVNSCFEACLVPRPNGRPRQYANRNEQQRAYRERKRREKTLTARDERKQSEKTLGE